MKRTARRLSVVEPVRGDLSPQDKFAGYKLRGLWIRLDSYGKLRNSAWLLRNSRVGHLYNPAAMRQVVHEAQVLVDGGEQLADVLEAFAELLVNP